MATRKKRRYTNEAEARGMRVVAKILSEVQDTIDGGYSLREWPKYLYDLHGGKEQYKFTHTDVARYRKAGTVVDKRRAVVEKINSFYLEAVQPMTPYPLEFLKDVLNGKFTGAIKPMSLEFLIAQLKEKIGDFEFDHLRKNLDITDEVLVRANQGQILKGDDGKLSIFLQLPVDEIWKANISQLDDRLNDSN